MDVVGASVLIVLCSPVFALVTVIVAADGGPIFHVSRRVGRGGRAFNCYKFRTMVVDADARLFELLRSDEAARAEWERVCKLVRDPRVTLVGRVLRAFSLDELPQLANVFMGSMSLVGPRPVPRPELEKYYGVHGRDYLSVRPGLTGPWQVSGRSDADYGRRVALDVEYARNVSIRTDLWILCRTVTAVLFCKGAR